MRSLSFFYFWTWFIETSFGISNDCCVLRLQFKGAAARAWKRTNANIPKFLCFFGMTYELSLCSNIFLFEGQRSPPPVPK